MSTLCYLWSSTFCPITLFLVVRFEKFLHKQGCFFQMMILSTTTLCCLENWKFCPIFLFNSILFALCLQKPYILLFKCNFGSFEWQFEMYCFFVDLETFSKIKLIWVPIQYYWSIPFPALNAGFFMFSCVCQIYVCEEQIIQFCNHYHLKFVSPCEYQIEINFWGSTLETDYTPDPYLGGTFDLNLEFTLALALVPYISQLSWLWLLWWGQLWIQM